MLDKNNIFNKIADHNNLPSLFPVDIKKTKLSNELKEQIFKEFSFKFITAGSSSNKILKEIYNTYFSKFIIQTFYDDSENQIVNYSINNDAIKHHEFAKENLLLDTTTYMTYNKLNQDDNEDNSIEI